MGSFSPQDQTRPDRGISGEPQAIPDGGSFADMPRGSEAFPAFGSKAEPESEPEPQQTPEEMLTPPEPAGEPERGVRAPDLEQAVFNALSRAAMQSAEAQQRHQQMQQAQSAWKPPELPDDWETVLSDPDKAKQTFQQQHQYTTAAIGALQQAVTMQQGELESYRIREARRTWDEARKDLIAEGVRDPDVYAGQIEAIIAKSKAQDPGFYWSVWTDKEKLVATAKMLRSQETPRGRESGRQSPQPASLGTTGAASSRGSGRAIPNYPEIAKVERMLGRRLSPSARQQFDEFKRRKG